jgi:ASC-1-like (ASCH) protein/GNAT superfamily N-acetyltransferase
MDCQPSAPQRVLEGSAPEGSAPEGSALTVMPATTNDIPYIVIAFERALGPYYGGDHTAHARRIIQTHLAGGTDPRGLLSTRQLLFVLWEAGRRRGLLNLAFKRQATCKISPLILFPENHRHRGLGTTLLETAEREAGNVGARELYCTVAQSNQATLQFFLDLGFVLCGEAQEQYKEGETEMLLRKPVGGALGHNGADSLISVTQVTDDIAWKEVRDLFLNHPYTEVEGGDDEWLESLRLGSGERTTGDHGESRQAYVYAAQDRTGKYRAAAIATSKKGGSLKVMPVAAADSTAFRALVLDLPALLVGKGRKAYIHHTPSSSEVAALQESGWRLEGQFPGHYREGMLTQQWGCRLDLPAAVPNLRIQDRYLRMITSGKKSLEVRVGYDHIKTIKPGSSIRLTADSGHMSCVVADVRSYPSLRVMIQHEDVEKALPGLGADEALNQLRRIYPPDKEQLGIVVLELS